MRPRWDEMAALRWTLILLLALLTVAVAIDANAEQACDPSLPQPPLVLVLDGQEIPVERVDYRTGARFVEVTRWQGVFCDGFER